MDREVFTEQENIEVRLQEERLGESGGCRDMGYGGETGIPGKISCRTEGAGKSWEVGRRLRGA